MRTYSRALRPVRHLEFAVRSQAYLLSHPEEAMSIRGNRGLAGSRADEECFILGNGPSLRDESLELLAGRTLISVNTLNASELHPELRSQYHVVSDRRFLRLSTDEPADREIAGRLGAIFSDPTIRSFVPSSELRSVVESRVPGSHNLGYFCNPFYFSDSYVTSHDFTRVVPRFCSVVQHAILLAMFLGFRRINLLGCDSTNIVANIESALGRSAASSYSHEITSSHDEWLRAQQARRTMERSAESYLEVLMGFRFLASYCEANGVELWNCSRRTVVDSVRRRPLEAT